MAKRDRRLGEILAGLDQRFMPAEVRRVANPATPAEVKAYGADVLAPKRGGRAYSMFNRTNTSKNERAGQEFRTFVKRDESGNAYRYHEYNDGGKRRVVRVGKAL